MGLTIFAERMKQSREKKGMKQNELAKAVNVTPTTISSYEKADTEGNGKKPTLENAQAIAETLGVSLDWLCGMSDAVGGGYTDFNAEAYLKSIVRILVEMSHTFSEKGIIFENEVILEFIWKINGLINAYHADSIPKDLFDVCIDKIIKDYSNSEIYCDCFFSSDEAHDVGKYVFNYFESTAGGIKTGIFKDPALNNLISRKVKLFISQNQIDRFMAAMKGVPDNGGNNPTDK